MYHIFCIHVLVEGYLGSFHLLAIANKAHMNIVEHVSLLYVGASFRYIPRSGIWHVRYLSICHEVKSIYIKRKDFCLQKKIQLVKDTKSVRNSQTEHGEHDQNKDEERKLIIKI